ncbi:hypothetical protein SAMN06297280_1805 [Arsukibacterium tuosuense]|uniref:DUF4412 domain-containing protein n=1 Tax=Arsukibacterium tuosuense TaxID=1323745 RepID=A0A285ITD5_9GAMM|nr:hypothetical protein [Arsukibacterium tuosuense]SNY51280.1 hypothetical protein SAMN06297280_1805 [Arsukibacterium tuosuense]
MYQIGILFSLTLASSLVFAQELSKVHEHRIASKSERLFDYDMSISDGESIVHLSVISNDDFSKTITVRSSDNEVFLREIEKIISNGGDSLSKNSCDFLKAKIPENSEFTIGSTGNRMYHFTPVPGDGDDKKIYRLLDAVAEVSKDSGEIISLEMTNRQVINPAFSTKIDEFIYSAKCMPISEGHSALKELKISVNGSAFLVPFNELVVQKYSNYRSSK